MPKHRGPRPATPKNRDATASRKSSQKNRDAAAPREHSPKNRSATAPREYTPKNRSAAAPRKYTPKNRDAVAPREFPPKNRGSTAPREYTPKNRSVAAPRKYTPKSRDAAAPREFPPKNRGSTAPREYTPKNRSVAAPRKYTPKSRDAAAPRESYPKNRDAAAPREYTPKNRSVAAPRKYTPKSRDAAAPREFPPKNRGSTAPREYTPKNRDVAPRESYPQNRDAAAPQESPPKNHIAAVVPRKLRAENGDDILVCGRRAVVAALAAGRTHCVWIDRRSGQAEIFAKQARDCDTEVVFATAAEITALLGDGAHQGIAAAVPPPPAVWADLLAAPASLLVVLDGVTDPRNLGAVMRTARAFSAAGVVAPMRRSAPLSAAAAKASAGAAAFLPLYRTVNLRRALSELRDAGWTIVGASDKAEGAAADAPFPACWVFGDEGGGLRRLTAESCEMLVRLPTTAGAAGCLNVAAACAACLALSTGNRLLE